MKTKARPGYTIKPSSVEQAWLNLATDILLLAIEDVRQSRDSKKREEAKRWLLSPAAGLFFDVLLQPEINIPAWVKSNCPTL